MSHRHRLLAVAALGAIALGAAIAPALAAKAPAKAPEKAPAKVEPKVDAKALFATNCAACHGAEGEGGLGPGLRKIEAKGDKYIAERLKNGSPEKGMPPFAHLKEAEIKALSAYVKTL